MKCIKNKILNATKYSKMESNFKGIFSRNNSSIIPEDAIYVTNLDYVRLVACIKLERSNVITLK